MSNELDNSFNNLDISQIRNKYLLLEKEYHKLQIELSKKEKILNKLLTENQNLKKSNNIEMNNVRLIIDKVKYDLSNIINECDKLMIYKDNDKNITKDDIENIIRENIEDDIFSLTNSILKKDTKKSIKIYKDLLLMGEEPIKLIVMIANQFRLLLQVKLMVKNGYKQIEMASIIKEHPYRVKLALSSNYLEDELISNIKKLYKLDSFGKTCMNEIENTMLHFKEDLHEENQRKQAEIYRKECKELLFAGDFSQIDEKENPWVLKYKEAYDLLDSALIKECKDNPKYVCEIVKAFIEFQKEYHFNDLRKVEVEKLISQLTESKRNNRFIYY